MSFSPATWKAFVTLDGSLSAVELAVGNWVPAANLGPGARVAVILFDENNPTDGVIVGAFGAALPNVEGVSWVSPTDYFTRFVNWTWATDGIFDGAPSTVDVATWPGLLRLANDSVTEDHFAYRTVSGAQSIKARLSRGVDSYIGLRLDDGAGGNYEQLSLVNGTTYGTMRVEYQGTSSATAYFYDGMIPSFYVLRLVRVAGVMYAYMTQDGPAPVNFFAAAAGSWTPTRSGIVFGQRGAADPGDRPGLVHWVAM